MYLFLNVFELGTNVDVKYWQSVWELMDIEYRCPSSELCLLLVMLADMIRISAASTFAQLPGRNAMNSFGASSTLQINSTGFQYNQLQPPRAQAHTDTSNGDHSKTIHGSDSFSSTHDSQPKLVTANSSTMLST